MWPYIHSMASSSVMAESGEEIAGTSLGDFKPVGRGSPVAKRKSHLGSCVLLPSRRAGVGVRRTPVGGTWWLRAGPVGGTLWLRAGPLSGTWRLGARPVVEHGG